ncbi:MAG: hypothetical protein PVI21_05370 [Candidatus Woesebacteria bacterium]|jgi:hypothetical protein
MITHPWFTPMSDLSPERRLAVLIARNGVPTADLWARRCSQVRNHLANPDEHTRPNPTDAPINIDGRPGTMVFLPSHRADTVVVVYEGGGFIKAVNIGNGYRVSDWLDAC